MTLTRLFNRGKILSAKIAFLTLRFLRSLALCFLTILYDTMKYLNNTHIISIYLGHMYVDPHMHTIH